MRKILAIILFQKKSQVVQWLDTSMAPCGQPGLESGQMLARPLNRQPWD